MPEAPDPVPPRGIDDGPQPVPRVMQMVARRSARQWATILHAGSLVVGFGIVLWIDRNQWFSGDEWDFLLKRGVLGDSALGLFEPHNEHWSTAPILVYRALYSLFGVRTYTPYLVVLVLLQVLVAHLLWRLMMRSGVQPLIATAGAAVFMVLGAGWENLVNAFQMSFLGSMALGLGALLAMPERGRFERRDVYGWILNVLALTFSGLGITMVLVAGGTAFVRRGWRVALMVMSVPGMAYLLWYAKWGRHADSVDQEPLRTALQRAPAFVWHGLVEAVDATTGLAGIGPVLLVLLAIWLVKVVRPEREPWPVVLMLALGAPVFLFLVDVRRSGLGLAGAAAPRYLWALVAFLVPVAALAATRLLDGRPLAVPAGLVATALLLTVGLSTLNENAAAIAPTKEENQRRLLAAVDLLGSREPVLSEFPLPELNPDITNRGLLAIARNGDLPDIRIDAGDRLNAAAFLQTGGAVNGTASPRAPGDAAIEQVQGATTAPTPGRSRCVTVSPTSDDPTVSLSFAAPGHFSASPQHGATFTTQLERAGGDGARSLPRAWAVPGGERLVLSVTATEPWLRLTLPPSGDTTLCNTVPPT